MRHAIPILGAAALALAVAVPVLATSEAGPLLVSVTTSPNPYAIKGNTTVTKSVGVLGYSTGTSGIALEGFATQPGGVGLEGFSQASSGAAGNGVFGYSANGSGVYAVGTSAAYPAIFGDNSAAGGVGISGTAQGNGVYGVTTAPSSAGLLTTAGVVGNDSSAGGNQAGVEGMTGTGVAVYAYAPFGGTGVEANAGLGTAVYGQSEASAYDAIYGYNHSTSSGHSGVTGVSDQGSGVYGQDDYSETASAGFAVYGFDIAPQESQHGDSAGVFGLSGNNDGVLGETETNGTGIGGVRGQDMSTSDGNAGVIGETTTGYGMFGSESGSDGAGIEGAAYGQGVGVIAAATQSSSTALDVQASGGAIPLRVYGGGVEVAELDASGNLTLKGSLTQTGSPSSTVRDGSGASHIAYGQRATSSTIEDFGEAQLQNGRAFIPLAADFASVLDRSSAYLVFITAEGPQPVYLANRTASGFEVRSTSNAPVAFEYRIVGHPRADRAEPRLALADRALVGHPISKPMMRGLTVADIARARNAMNRTRAAHRVHPAVLRPLPKPPKTAPMPFVYRPH